VLAAIRLITGLYLMESEYTRRIFWQRCG
jgi:hypothetical protein